MKTLYFEHNHCLLQVVSVLKFCRESDSESCAKLTEGIRFARGRVQSYISAQMIGLLGVT